MDTTKMWDYRVVRQPSKDGNDGYWYSIQEVYYDDDEKPMAHTMDLQVNGDSIADLRKTLQAMLWCLDKDVVPEIESSIPNLDIEDRVSKLEEENQQLKDRLVDLKEKEKEIMARVNEIGLDNLKEPSEKSL